MMRLTASLFVGLFVSLETEVHKQFIPIFPAGKIGLPSLFVMEGDDSDVQRFNVKDKQ